MERRPADSSRVTFKINVSGSWANLVTCDAEVVDDVKIACETIAECGGGAKYKILDASGAEIEAYGLDRSTGLVGWHAAQRLR